MKHFDTFGMNLLLNKVVLVPKVKHIFMFSKFPFVNVLLGFVQPK